MATIPAKKATKNKKRGTTTPPRTSPAPVVEKPKEKPKMKSKPKGGASVPAKKAENKPTTKERARAFARKAKAKAAGVLSRAGFPFVAVAVDSAVGAGSAVAMQYAWQKIKGKLPEGLSAGKGARAARIALGFGLGYGVSKLGSKRHGVNIARGVATVELAELAKEAIIGAASGGVDGLGELYEVARGVYFDRDSGLYLDDAGNIVNPGDSRLNGLIFTEEEAA